MCTYICVYRILNRYTPVQYVFMKLYANKRGTSVVCKSLENAHMDKPEMVSFKNINGEDPKVLSKTFSTQKTSRLEYLFRHYKILTNFND